MEQQGVLSVLVHNRQGVLTRVSSLFTRKAFNIKSISAGQTEDPRFTRITIIAVGDERECEQLKLQLEKLEDVVRAQVIPWERLVTRELMMVKIRSAQNQAFLKLAERYCARELDDSDGCAVWSVAGSSAELDEFLESAKDFGVLEACRTGEAAMETGARVL